MTDHPILFSGAMVRSLLACRKTQTRRLATSPLRRVEVGDRLWVRETTRVVEAPDYSRWVHFMADTSEHALPTGQPWEDRAEKLFFYGRDRGVQAFSSEGRSVPSIHMPRWASRLTLIVEDVRVQSLWAISETDARAEGVTTVSERNFVSEYEALWNSLHKVDGQVWNDDPAVVALTFRVVRGNIDRIVQ